VLATGVTVEAFAPREVSGASQPVPVNPVLHNRGQVPVTVRHADMRLGGTEQATEMAPFSLLPDSSCTLRVDASRPKPSYLRWLVRPRRSAIYDYAITGRDEGSYAREAFAGFDVRIGEAAVHVQAPIVHRYANQVIGDVRRAVAGVPDVSVLLDQQLQYAPARVPIERDLRVQLRSASDIARDVRVEVRLPSGLLTDSAVRTIALCRIAALMRTGFK
jgi:hypothetical protein